jgi:hypothetical protein
VAGLVDCNPRPFGPMGDPPAGRAPINHRPCDADHTPGAVPSVIKKAWQRSSAVDAPTTCSTGRRMPEWCVRSQRTARFRASSGDRNGSMPVACTFPTALSPIRTVRVRTAESPQRPEPSALECRSDRRATTAGLSRGTLTLRSRFDAGTSALSPTAGMRLDPRARPTHLEDMKNPDRRGRSGCCRNDPRRAAPA